MIINTLKDIAAFIGLLVLWSIKIGIGAAIFGSVWYGVHAAVDWTSWSTVEAGNRVGVALCFTVMIFVVIGLCAMAVAEANKPRTM